MFKEKRKREEDSEEATGSASQPLEAPQDLTPSRSAPAPPVPELSDSGRTISASLLAGVSHLIWMDVENRNNCELRQFVGTISLFKDYMDEIKFPRCILDEEFVNSISTYDEQMLGFLDLNFASRPDYRRWSLSLPADKKENGNNDPYDLKHWGYTLHKSWSSHFVAVRDSGNEAEIRNETANLFELAFQQQCHWKHRFREEQEVFLPAAPHVAKADIIITTDLPQTLQDYLNTQSNPCTFAFGQKFGTVMTFASEAKCDKRLGAQRQLMFDLCSAQHQRRALGFENGRIFGATVVRNTLTMYCSHWVKGDQENEKVVVFPVKHEFTLNSFPAFIECYIFLCKVANHVSDEIDRVFRDWESGSDRSKYEERMKRSQRTPWRCPVNPSRTRTTARGSSRRAGSGDSAQDAMEPFEDWEEDWEDNGMSVTPHERQRVYGDGQLVRENLQAFDAYPGVELKGRPNPPAKDIIGWIRTLSENHP